VPSVEPYANNRESQFKLMAVVQSVVDHARRARLNKLSSTPNRWTDTSLDNKETDG
jgi:hypothetical protein